VSDRDRTVEPPLGTSDYDDVIDADEHPGNYATGLVSLGFITAALRRSVWLWCATAVAGFLIGLGIYVARPAVYQASTTVVIVPNPVEQPTDAVATDVALAQSRTVAGRVVNKLGLHESITGFLGTYTVTAITDRVLVITVSAPSSGEAVTRAGTLATEFLQFRAQQAQSQEQIALATLQRQIALAQQKIKAINGRKSQFPPQPTSPTQQATVNQLQAQLEEQNNQLLSLQQAVDSQQQSTAQIMQGSQVIDKAAPILQSHYKRAVLYVVAGLIAGLGLGMGFVIVRALVSDRLRRRDDVAYALGAPVGLSVGTLGVGRWRPGRSGLVAAEGRDMRRVIAYLRDAVPRRSGRVSALAVVAVDNAQVAALSVTSLAMSCAEKGEQVVLADLCSGAPAAQLLGVKDPGVRPLSTDGTHLVLAVPGRDNVAPVGPLARSSPQAGHSSSRELAAACVSADLLLTLVTLDPSLGAEHLATWAADAIVMVTAGRSSATRIEAVGEMIRLAGMRMIPGVLVGADKTDESLGVTHRPIPPTQASLNGQESPAGSQRQVREG
jgi:capsular polysaccharide biosynthesis protein